MCAGYPKKEQILAENGRLTARLRLETLLIEIGIATAKGNSAAVMPLIAEIYRLLDAIAQEKNDI